VTNTQAKNAVIFSNKVKRIEENFLGTGWWFIETISGNYWYHRASVKILPSSSTWNPNPKESE